MKITLPFQRFMPLKHASILLVFFTFFSCEKEDSDLIENPANAEEIMIKTYNSKDFEFDTSLLDKLKETKSILSVREKSFYDSINHFYVDDSRFNHLKQGQYESYSFEIVDTADSLFDKQLVLATKSNGQNEIYYESYIAKIPKINILPGTETGDLISNEIQLTKLKTNFTFSKDLSYSTIGDCLYVYSVVTTYPPCWNDHEHDAPKDPDDMHPSCDLSSTTDYTFLSASCSGDSGGDSSSGSSGSSYSGSGDTDGSSGSSGNFDPDGSTPFSPVETCPKSGGTSLTSPDGCTTDVDQYNREQLMLEEFYNSLGSAFLTWINDPQNIDFKLQLESFLKSNMRDLTSFAFARAAVEAKSLNPRFTEVDWDERIIENLSGRTKEVYKILKASDPFFAEKLIRDNFESGKETLLILSMGDLPSSVNSDTPALLDLNYDALIGEFRTHKIVFDKNRIQNFTNIEIAQITIHEFLHTELMERSIQLGLFTRVESVQNIFEPLPSNIPINVAESNDVIFAYMVNNYRATPSTASDWNHNAFSIENYRGKIVDAMLSVHPFLTDPSPTSAFPPRSLNNMTLREIFEDFSWNGLKETAEYLALDQSVKDRIEFVTEEINRTYSRTL
ncbi:hypothetical protein [Nonlabens marinus]|uniref:Uncharacterized protein n=1 Tax=Nonlabens marinus S1-08 TaxID=1454201 RepID=W8VWG3_9FLAO|nr:hypothetical protein [Nonlabens marinus]BAO54707.1 hypothetical protein NMS_0698 [Nonlabens marinus S1-08]